MEEEIGWKHEESETNGIVDEDGGLDGEKKIGKGYKGFQSGIQKFYTFL